MLNGCVTWSPTEWKEYRLRVLGNKLLGKILGHRPNRAKIIGGWKELHNK
jgi:hypothetical protein